MQSEVSCSQIWRCWRCKAIGAAAAATITGTAIVEMQPDKDRNTDVTIFLNLDSGKEWISNIVNGNRGAKSQRTETENNSSGKLEFERSGANLFVGLIFVTTICTEI